MFNNTIVKTFSFFDVMKYRYSFEYLKEFLGFELPQYLNYKNLSKESRIVLLNYIWKFKNHNVAVAACFIDCKDDKDCKDDYRSCIHGKMNFINTITDEQIEMYLTHIITERNK